MTNHSCKFMQQFVMQQCGHSGTEAAMQVHLPTFWLQATSTWRPHKGIDLTLREPEKKHYWRSTLYACHSSSMAHGLPHLWYWMGSVRLFWLLREQSGMSSWIFAWWSTSVVFRNLSLQQLLTKSSSSILSSTAVTLHHLAVLCTKVDSLSTNMLSTCLPSAGFQTEGCHGLHVDTGQWVDNKSEDR